MSGGGKKARGISQEGIVIAISAVIFLVFAVTQPVFRTPENILSLIQNVSILGILAGPPHTFAVLLFHPFLSASEKCLPTAVFLHLLEVNSPLLHAPADGRLAHN